MNKMKKRMKQWMALMLTLSLLLPVNAFALPSEGTGEDVETGSIAEIEYSDDQSNALESGDAEDTHEFRIKHPDKPVTPDSIRGDYAGGLRIQGASEEKTLPLVMIVVSYNNIGYDKRHEWYDDLFGDKDSLQYYYSIMSNRKFTWEPAEETCSVSDSFDVENDGIIHVTLNEDHGEWGDTDNADKMGTIDQSLIAALDKADEYIDFSKYDRNDNKKIENNELGVGFILAGYEAAVASKGTKFYNKHKDMMLWSHQSEMSYEDDSEGYFDGVRIASYIAVPDFAVIDSEKEDVSDANVKKEDLGVVYHELGHYLGLPDFYDTEYLESTKPDKAVWMGYDSYILSLMDEGGNAKDLKGNKRTSALDAWSRAFLEWEEPEIADKDGVYTLYSQESGKYNILKIPTERENEYYLLENRRTEGIDIGLKIYETRLGEGRIASSNGLVLWHIDDDVYNKYKSDNKVNNTDHRPAIVPLFAESLKENRKSFTLDFKGSKPYTNETDNIGLLPFYSKSNFEAIFGDIKDYEEGLYLPVYGEGDKADDPDSRYLSNIRLEFIDNDSREMKVRISGVPEPEPESEPENKKDKYSSGEALSSILSEEELSILGDPSVSVASKNGVLSNIDRAIESRVKGKGLISFNSAIKGYKTSKEYWVRIVKSRALRYDGRKHSLSNNGKSSALKNPDIDFRVFYCEKSGKYADSSPSGNLVISGNLVASANDGWTEAKVKKITIKNSNKSTFDYRGKKNGSVKGYRGSAYICKIVLADKELNRTLGKGLNRMFKDLSKKLKYDKLSSYTDADLEKTGGGDEKQLIIPVYPLFIGLSNNSGNYIDGKGVQNKYTVEKGNLYPNGKKLKGAKVSISYASGNSKKLKLRFSSKKIKDFDFSIVDLKDQQSGSKRQLTAAGNYFGFLEY